MHLSDHIDSTNLIDRELEWFHVERLDWFRRNNQRLSINAIGSFEEIMPTNSSDLILRLYAKSAGRTVKDKGFIPTIW